MVFKKTAGRAVSAITASLMLASMVQFPVKKDNGPAAFAAGASVIDSTKEYQNIRGFGGINHPEWTGQDMSDAQLATAFGNDDGQLGLTVLRVFVNPDKNQWNKAVHAAKYVSNLGYTVFASPWEPPSNLAASGGVGNLKGKLHLPESNYGAYATHLNDFGTYMKNQGVDLYSISVQNEPDYAEEWTAWSTDQACTFIANYGDKITSTRLMSPESFQYGRWGGSGKEYYKKILANSKAFANCDVFGTHFYGTSRSDMDFPELESCGKEIWMTEVYVPNSNADSANNWPEALQVAENIHNGLVVGNMSAYVWWYIRRSYGLMTENGVPSKRGWMMAQYSKFVRPGATRIDATEQPNNNVLVSAYKNEDGSIAIVAINKGSSEVTQEFTISSGEKIGKVDRYRTTSNENCALTADMNASETGFFASLPSNSVSTFVITPEGGTTSNTNQPDENGYWFRHPFEGTTNGWTGRGAASADASTKTSYEGSGSLYVSGRESEWNGAIFGLNKNFKAGEEYSFSVNAAYTNGDDTRDFKLTLEYTDASGETTWDEIASGTTSAGQWIQLANTNYKLPAGGSNFKIIVETTDGTLEDFYIDEAIGAVAGTKIAGAGQPTVVVRKAVPGDINFDGIINIFDVVEGRKLIQSGSNISDAKLLKACDVDQNNKYEAADLIQIHNYVIGKITEFEKDTSVPPQAAMKTISEYTPIAQAKLAMNETNDSKANKGGVNYGTLEKKSYYSNFCGRNKPYNVLLPANYDKNKQYPVMYVMHGYWENQDRMIIEGNGKMSTQQIIGNAIAEGAAKEMIVVFPYIYSSKTQNDCTAMDDANNVAYDNFETVLLEELMPLIEKEYSVATGKANTAITGFSMGGRESLNIGMRHQDVFGYVGAICPAPGASGPWSIKSEESAPSLIYITAGGNDTVVYTTPQGYHDNLTKNNVPHIWHYYENGYHGDNSIHAHLYNFVRFAFQA